MSVALHVPNDILPYWSLWTHNPFSLCTIHWLCWQSIEKKYFTFCNLRQNYEIVYTVWLKSHNCVLSSSHPTKITVLLLTPTQSSSVVTIWPDLANAKNWWPPVPWQGYNISSPLMAAVLMSRHVFSFTFLICENGSNQFLTDIDSVCYFITSPIITYSFSIVLSGYTFSRYHRKFLHCKRFLSSNRSVRLPAKTFLTAVNNKESLFYHSTLQICDSRERYVFFNFKFERNLD